MNGLRKCGVGIYSRILPSDKKKWNLATCENIGRPRGYYANKSDRGRQIQYDFTYMWNLKTKTNEQT